MKKNIITLAFMALGVMSLTGCIQEIEPQSSTVTSDQAGNAPNSYNNFVNSITTNICGSCSYYGGSPKEAQPWDFGYPSQMLVRDMMGQDMAANMGGSEFFMYWYSCSRALGPQYAICQVPWTIYYNWIKNCNTVISLAGENPTEDKISGAGIAYCMRAFFYEDLAQMFTQKTYGEDKEAETVPIVTEDNSIDYTHNPRATNEKMWAFILSDLDKAETYLANYDRGSDKTKPNLSVVYGLKARAYLIMRDWANAEKYAKLAQNGYQVMSADEYTSRETGFNTANESWMFCMKYKADDICIKENDGDNSWGTQMCLELDPATSEGYASAFGAPKIIDSHLYSTIPATDCRKKCFVDFSVDNMTQEQQLAKLAEYSNYPSWLQVSASKAKLNSPAGFSLKFRLAGGEAGHKSQYIGYLMDVPLMRVEEMKLIEAEAAGMQDEARGKALLEAFAKTRDPQYVYGKHNEAYGNSKTSAFENEIWWQRRVELWGEGFSTFDIKRLNKGIIRNYAGTNHQEDYRWNTTTPPQWMTFCIVQSETNYNKSCTQNPTPIAPEGDSDEFVW